MAEAAGGEGSKLAVAESELEEDRKSLDKRESHAANMEKQLERQREALKNLKESAVKKKAELEERTREVEAAKAALDTRVQEGVQEAVRKLQEDHRVGTRVQDGAHGGPGPPRVCPDLPRA